MSGSRASVQADDFSFDCSMDGTKALISTPTKQAAVTFESPQADVQWFGGKVGNVCSSHLSNIGPIYAPLVLSSYATGWTLGTAETLVEYYSHDLAISADYFSDIGFYGSYFFYISEQSGSCNRVYIDGTNTLLSGSIFADPDYTNSNTPRFCVMSETIVYVLYGYTGGATDEIRLAKLDFSDLSRELLYSWDDETIVDGDSKLWSQTAWMARAKYGEKDYLVAVTDWLGDSHPALFRILMWDTVADDLIGFDFEYVMGNAGSGTDLAFPNYNFATRPSMYEGRMIFTAIPNYYDETSSELPWPSFMVDLADDSLTKITESHSGTVMAASNVQGSGLDQTTGVYYVWVANNDETASPHDILSIDLTDGSPHYSVSNSLSDPGTIIMGETQAWAAKFLTVPSRFQIYGPLPVYNSQVTTANNKVLFVDETNNVAWQLATDYNSINGYELSGGTNKSITLTWTGAKYKYASTQSINPVFMFDGLYAVIVYSRKTTVPTAFQRELVIFGEEA
jgi:hypothetical protein